MLLAPGPIEMLHTWTQMWTHDLFFLGAFFVTYLVLRTPEPVDD